MRSVIGMLQTISCFAYAGLFVVVLSPALLVELFIGRRDPYKADIQCLRMVEWGFRCLDAIAQVTSTVIGHENVPTDTAVLYVANHNSYFDIFLTYSLCPDRTGYIAKSILGKIPFLNLWMHRVYCLFIDRDDMRQSMRVIQKAIEYVKDGISITIFPEGTRGDSEEMIPFKPASFRIAEKTGCPVVPIAISGTRHIVGDNYPCVTPTHVIVQYGRPIYPDDLPDKKAISRIAQERIQEMLDAVKRGEITAETAQRSNSVVQ